MTLTLMQHQSALRDRSRVEPRLGIGWEPGLGKSIGTLAIISDAKARGFVGPTVVVAPKSILWSAWGRDAENFPDLKVQVVVGEKSKRRQLIHTPGVDVFVMGYETFKTHTEDLLSVGVNRLACDEASKARNERSQISIALFNFSRRVESVYMLSGTPAPNGGHEFFGIIRCIDPGVFGMNFWRFASTYFVPQKKTIQGKERIIGWKPIEQRREMFLAKLAGVWWTLRAQDCLDLPPVTDVIREVTLGPEEARLYVSVLQELEAEFEDGEITQVAAAAKTMKLRQITGGHLYGDADSSQRVRKIGTAKLEALAELLEELGNRPVVIWAEFTAEIHSIAEMLSDFGRSVARIDGSASATDRAHYVAQFQAGKLQYLVCHPAAAAHGLTLTAARFDVFYSLGWFTEMHEQARARIYRVSQHWPVTHFYLIAEGTVDARVLRVQRGKMTASEAMKELLSSGRREMVLA